MPTRGSRDLSIHLQVHLLLLETAPDALNENVVRVPPLPIMADLYAQFPQQLQEGLAGELGTLIRVEHVRRPFAQCLFQGVYAEGAVPGVGEPSGQELPAVPAQDHLQVQKTPGHGNVRDIRRPHLVWPGNG